MEGAKANGIDGAVPEHVKEERLARFMAKQADISAARLQAKIGKTIDVLIDEVDEEGAIARSRVNSLQQGQGRSTNGHDPSRKPSISPRAS